MPSPASGGGPRPQSDARREQLKPPSGKADEQSMADPCPRCRASGFQSGESACGSCGWQDPVLEPWVPSGWYTDPANPNQARQWDKDSRNWVGKPRKDAFVSPRAIPTSPPPPKPSQAIENRDPAAGFRAGRMVALIAALLSGALTATHWYVFSLGGTIEGTLTKGEGLWTAHPALGALIVAGAVLVAGTSAASLFRVPNDRPNLPPIVLGFAMVAASAMVVCSIIGLASTPEAPSEVHVADAAWGVLTLLLAMIAVGGTGVMFLAGRERPSEASVSSVREPSEVPESPMPAPGAHAASAAAPTTGQALTRDSDDDPVKRCPECAEWVKDAAHVCRYCGFRFASQTDNATVA
jgi:hypothetical protein